MKKLVFYFVFIMIMTFAMPMMFTNTFVNQENIAVNSKIENNDIKENNNIYQNIENNYDYGKINNINLLHVDTGQIENIKLDEYLYGVVAAEMPASYEIEALKAQAIVARTYTLYKIKNNEGKHPGADICDSSLCCQAWMTKENRMARWENDKELLWSKIMFAVNSTAGKYVTYNGDVINAFFHSNSGGRTELAINVWGGDYPYLQCVETSGEENYSTYNSNKIISKDELIQKMLEKYSDFKIDFKQKDCIQILEYTDSGRIKKLKVGNKEISGIDARTIFELKSSNFTISLKGDNIEFNVKGYGHGVGLSQSGSDSLAKQGKNCDEIIKHYYKDVEIHE